MPAQADSDRAPFCFRARRSVSIAVVPMDVGLKSGEALALAQLVPLLGCGEEAAALAFDRLATREADPEAHAALRAIAEEERVHEHLLLALSAALPSVDAAAAQRAARRFHIDLGRGSDVAHLARIAAIDAGVCTILSRLLRAGRPLGNEPNIAALLTRIRRDESRHVMLSRRLAIGRARERTLEDMAAAAREAMANVMMLASDAFEVLAVDPARLLADLRRLPKGLLRE